MGNELLVRFAGYLSSPRGIRRNCLCTLIYVCCFSAGVVHAAERRFLDIERPPKPGRCLVSGTVFFNPGKLASADSIRILETPDLMNIGLEVLFSEEWPGGNGIMSADIAFVITDDALRTKSFILEWGMEKRVKNAEVDRTLPEVHFNLGREVSADNVQLPVGTLTVKVRKHPELFYYWYLLPIGIILGLLIWRKLHIY